MTFKKPEEVVGNHIAKHQAMKLAKMIMAYDFERRLNPFAELGGFIFTFMGDGAPGTGKTTLIQMMAGLIHGYCEVAGYPFRYRNLSTDNIDSYQGKSARTPSLHQRDHRPHGDRLRHHRRHRHAWRQARRPAVLGGPARDHGGADGKLCRGEHRGAGELHLRDVLELSRERGRRAAPARGRPLPRGRAADAGGLHRHPGAAFGQEPPDPGRGARTLCGSAASARGGRKLRLAFPPKEEGSSRSGSGWSARRAARHAGGLGTYLKAIQEVDPRFTGARVKNITDAVKVRAMDVELPDEWMAEPELFLRKDYDTKAP
jgi:energy-coupling factor transporter ATP-binding protein EcfA2